MPLYLKSHSWGEYVFDWAWADAYERNGLEYYPKLVSAIPFTPVMGPRLLAPDASHRQVLLEAALALAGQLEVSSLHVLFPRAEELPVYSAAGLMLRQGVQFHWQNQGYASFDAFLAAFSHDKRKKVRQDRRKVTEAGIHFNWRTGNDIRPQDWAFFNRCYRATYRAHHSTPYLNLAFFQALGAALPERILLIEAVHDGHPVAAALNLFDDDTLYGRYWGAVEYWPNLHFETCYYQPIEYCIQHGLQHFEAGAQGEHKLARGLLPVATHSAHWLAQPQFARAVEEFLSRETAGMQHYLHELNEHSPFQKKDS